MSQFETEMQESYEGKSKTPYYSTLLLLNSVDRDDLKEWVGGVNGTKNLPPPLGVARSYAVPPPHTIPKSQVTQHPVAVMAQITADDL